MEKITLLSTENSFPLTYNGSYTYENLKSFAQSIPVLNAKEERILLENYKINNSLESAQKLVLSQLKTVFNVVYQYRNYGLPKEDLLQEGNIGLMKAVKNYDLNQNVRLYTYAMVWIKSEIQTYILKNWKIVKVATTKNLKKLFFNFRHTQQEMIAAGQNKNLLTENLINKFNVNVEDVKIMQEYFHSEDVSIELENENNQALQIPDFSTPEKKYKENIEDEKNSQILKQAVEILSEREKKIIKNRFLSEEKKTHKELSKEIHVSSERIRQIEEEALKKMRIYLENQHHLNKDSI